MTRSWTAALGGAALLPWLAASAGASVPQPRQVLVVTNTRSEDSVRIAERYATARGLPPDHVLRLSAPLRDEVSRDEYSRLVEHPIGEWLLQHGAQDQVLYIVLTKGIPLRIAGTTGREGTRASVDSELTLLYRRLTGAHVALAGPIPNPYYVGESPPDHFPSFSHSAQDVTLVTRLDGHSADDVLSFIDRVARPTREGAIALDLRGGDEPGPRERLMSAAAEALRRRNQGARLSIDGTSRAFPTGRDLLGYFTAGGVERGPRAQESHFVPGGLVSGFFADDARSFAAGGETALLTTAVRAGAAAAGAIGEPYTDGALRPAVLFSGYLGGLNQVEAFYASMPYVSWQFVVVADPFCAPFGSPAGAGAEPAIDEHTGLPAYFSTRRLALLSSESKVPEARVAMARAESALARDNFDDARRAIVAALDADPMFVRARIVQAGLLKRDGAYAQAAEAYRAALTVDPRQIAALNDLAALLSGELGRPSDALTYAEQAVRLAPDNPEVADTTGWIHHLLGDDAAARRYLEAAVAKVPDREDFRRRLVQIYTALGETALAARELDALNGTATAGAASDGTGAAADTRTADTAGPAVITGTSRSRRASMSGTKPGGPRGKFHDSKKTGSTRDRTSPRDKPEAAPKRQRRGGGRIAAATEVGLREVCSARAVSVAATVFTVEGTGSD